MTLQSYRDRLKKIRRPTAWLLACAMTATTFTAIAVQDAQGRAQVSNTADCDGLRAAAQGAVNNHLLIVDSFMKGATESMQNAVSTNNSCIGDAALADIDLSGLVPDFGILGALLNSAVDKLVKGVINRVCNEIKSVVQTATGSWNGAVTGINKDINLNGQVQAWARDVDYRVDGAINANIGSTATPRSSLGAAAVVAPILCVNTLNGKVCSDGKTSTDGAFTQSGGGGGAYAGAEFVRRVEACNGAVSRFRAYNGDNGLDLSEVRATCGDLQNFVSANAAYISPGSVPSYPEFPITTPNNLGSGLFGQSAAATGAGTSPGAFSLPVRP